MLAARDVQRLAVILRLARALAADHDVDAVIAEDALQLPDVGETRHVFEDQRLIGEQARDHQRQRGVLGAGDRDRAVEPLPPTMRMRSMPRPPFWQTPPIPCEPRRHAEKASPSARLLLGSSCAAYVRQFRRNRGAYRGARGPPRARLCALCLGLATLEVLPQRRAQAPLLACLLPALVRAFGPLVHGGKDTNRRGAKEGPLCEGCRGRSVLAPLWTLWQGSPHSRPHLFYSHPARRCRSSVVEHSLGKGEVVSSILTGSTRKSPINKGLSHTRENALGKIVQNKARTRRAKTHQISTKRSADVHAARG